MAQKRNPVSLRLQTRLRGYEKRFGSCWFTDSFFSQVCTKDLLLRLYCGHLLQKGGSWYGEVSESRIPESCISLQFLYRKSSILFIMLDKRKEEYTISNNINRARRKDSSIPLQSESGLSYITAKNNTRGQCNDDSALNINTVKQDNSYARGVPHCKAVQPIPLFAYPRSHEFSDKMIYFLMANAFTRTFIQHHCPLGNADKNKSSFFSEITSPCKQAYKSLSRLHLQNSKHQEKTASCYSEDQGFSSLSLIESICNVSQMNKKENNSFTYHKLLSNVGRGYEDQIFIENRENSFSRHIPDRLVAVEQFNGKPKTAMLFVPPNHWTSLNLIRGVSAYQNIEFCLHSVALLYGQRFSFLKIKEAIFKKLACDPNVRGARLVCSGRQGGRSKSAMRAKKQCASLGRTALSLFSSRLAFASTNIDTTFGQIGVKLWICYK